MEIFGIFFPFFLLKPFSSIIQLLQSIVTAHCMVFDLVSGECTAQREYLSGIRLYI